ncbi:hypothetical protein DFQ26_005830 [Actinomortierella ambigua]|nr:hypothetical protein DFQ26_005830 [Actinomortierella ambigua]
MANIPSPHSFIFTDEYICLWDNCMRNFDDAEVLYEHLRDDHVGRKANHNLCLTCKWDKCTVDTFAKRDHITSHLRVHVPSKPYHCEVCRKGFKRPQDLKKHEKIHQDDKDQTATTSAAAAAAAPVAAPSGGVRSPVAGAAPLSGHLQPRPDQNPNYQPLTPPTHMDRSPSVAASTLSSLSPYSMPLSPASIADSADNWLPELASPSYSTNSELYSSPSAPDLELDIMTPTYGTYNSNGGRPTIDISGAFYGSVDSTPFDDIISPLSAKRPRDGFEELLSDTLSPFVMESKKKKIDTPYNEDMVSYLNALTSLEEVAPLTPDRLLNSLTDVNDWNQLKDLTQVFSNLYEGVSGEIFHSQSFDLPLFPDCEQKQSPMALEGELALQGAYHNYAATAVLQDTHQLGHFGGATTSNSEASIYQRYMGEDPFVTAAPASSSASLSTLDPALVAGASILPWIPTAGASSTVTPSPGVVNSAQAKNAVRQHNPFAPGYVVLQPTMNANVALSDIIKQEPEEVKPSVGTPVERKYQDMATQTKARQEAMMMMRREPKPATRKMDKRRDTGKDDDEEVDPEVLLMSAPRVPTTPLPVISVELSEDDESETEVAADAQRQDEQADENVPVSTAADTTASSENASTSRFGDIMKRARESQARTAAAAAAAAAAQQRQEPLDPVEAMAQRLASTHLDGTTNAVAARSSTTRPVAEVDMRRQMKAAQARALCAEDPVRRQHAETVLNLLKSIDSLMTEHKLKVAQYRSSQQQVYISNGAAGAGSRIVRPSSPASAGARAGYPRGGNLNAQNHGQIRTVSSYLPRRMVAGSAAPAQPSPLHHEATMDPDYHQLRSSFMNEGGSNSSAMHTAMTSTTTTASVSSTGANTIASGISSPSSTLSSSSSAALYPTSDLHPSSAPFELTDEERRIIEEDNAKTAAAQAAAIGYHSIHV